MEIIINNIEVIKSLDIIETLLKFEKVLLLIKDFRVDDDGTLTITFSTRKESDSITINVRDDEIKIHLVSEGNIVELKLNSSEFRTIELM